MTKLNGIKEQSKRTFFRFLIIICFNFVNFHLLTVQVIFSCVSLQYDLLVIIIDYYMKSYIESLEERDIRFLTYFSLITAL